MKFDTPEESITRHLKAKRLAMQEEPYLTIKEITFCANECKRQQSGELSVLHMCEAFSFISGLGFSLEEPAYSWRVERLLDVACLVEPEKNREGFRKLPVTVKGTVIPVQDFQRKLEILFEHVTDPTEWYREFQLVHPFNDGNGRVGALFFNALSGTLKNPVAPPNLFGN
jgi:hypothetical protein